jgi:hypothetical protein
MAQLCHDKKVMGKRKRNEEKRKREKEKERPLYQ